MRPHERLRKCVASVYAGLILCLALPLSVARAEPFAMQEIAAFPMAAMSTPAMPEAMDCLPCASCYVAPAPATTGFVGKCRESLTLLRWIRPQAYLTSCSSFDGGTGRSRVPIRIAFCRWLA